MLEPFGDRAIISAGRRSDIPAFHSEWLVNRLRAGFVMVKRPYARPPQYDRISLAPDHARGVVFWSKNYGPLLNRLDEITALVPNLYFHFTITGLPRFLEKHVPGPEHTIPQLVELSRRFSPDHVCWRFDPVCLLGDLDMETHLDIFKRLADRLAGCVRRCTISFIQHYAKAERAMRRHAGMELVPPPPELKQECASRLHGIARDRGIRLHSCCDPDIVSEDIKRASCIDAALLSKLWNSPGMASAPKGATRKNCGCFKSIDISAYDTCGHGCLYCYAVSNPAQARRFAASASPKRPAPDEGPDSAARKM